MKTQHNPPRTGNRQRPIVRLITCLACCLPFLLLIACDRLATQQTSPIVSLHTELGGAADGFQRACSPIDFVFPEDHAAHPSFRNEWWYFTGNLENDSGERFGFHVTLFRVATQPPATTQAATNVKTALEQTTENQATQPANNGVPVSSWATEQFYMGHFAISAADAEQVVAHERFARAAAGLAGASPVEDSVRVWLDDWQITHRQSDNSDFNTSTWTLALSEDGDALDLSLTPQKPIVRQGIDGYSQKSGDPCNASYYYSVPRMQATGTLQRGGQTHTVSGSAWLDREWSSSALADDQVGWDWFALQLDDGRDIMFYRLRQQNGQLDPHSHAVVVDRHGQKTVLPLPEYRIDRWWRSESGARYPVAGSLTFELPATSSDEPATATRETIHFKPLIDNQELELTVRYWEGAIRLTDTTGDAIGRGYLELTGY